MRRLAGLALLLLALAACSNRPGYALAQRPDDAPRVADKRYYDVLERYTAYRSQYDGFDHRFFFAATWQSWAFRQAKVEASAQFLAMSPEEKAALLEQERAEAGQFVDFVVGFYTADSEWNDLSSSESIWRVDLVLPDGKTVEPLAVERVVRPNANMRALYGWLAPFWQAYRVRFPGVDASGAPLLRAGAPFELRITSALGKALPEWDVQPHDLP